MDQIRIYVSPNGNDSNSGTRDCPLATLEGARQFLRSVPHDGATVTLLEGTYLSRSAVEFTDQDGGSPNAPVVYEAEGNVVFSGGETISHDKLGSVTDSSMAARFQDVSKIRALDISSVGFPADTKFGTHEGMPQFFAGEKMFEIARFPNSERRNAQNAPYIYANRTVFEPDSPSKNALTMYFDSDEAKSHFEKWSKESLEDMYLYGYFWHDWNFCRYSVIGVDHDEGTLTVEIKNRIYERVGDNKDLKRRSFVSNIPEELDDKGEYFYDKKKQIIYFIANDDFTDETEMIVSVSSEPAVRLNGTNNIVFRNIKFRYFRKEAIIVENTSNVTFDGCEISYSASRAATVTKSSHFTFENGDIFQNSAGGIYFFSCGDRYNLISCENAVINCRMHDNNRIETCYYPGVNAKDTCGLTVKGCTLSDAPHAVIIFEHINDMLIEDNRIINACQDTDDSSAIYWGRDPSDLGIVIRGNYFENIGNHEVCTFSVAAIYIDDWSVCPEIYNNVFYDCGKLSKDKMTPHTNATAIVMNNAQFLCARNNIFVGTYQDQKPCNLYPCPSTLHWTLIANGALPGDLGYFNDTTWYKVLKEAGFFTDTWKEHYKNTPWAAMWDYVNDETRRMTEEYYEAHKDQSPARISADISWLALDKMWDHTDQNGEHCDCTAYEYVVRTYPEKVAEYLKDYEHNPPTGSSAMAGFLFWEFVMHRMRIRTSNIFENNLCIGLDRTYLTEDEKLKGNVMNGFENNYIPLTDKLPDGSSMFRQYGKDFTLTLAGLEEVKKHLPEFHNFDVSSAGAKR
ncbi:MAG: right-handed parallel beta-helix repeat-containing protein [Firmicutes bacterium]|nr:right-handed parallel beta-helix repeat-containing protein [Bacillota bacterium]